MEREAQPRDLAVERVATEKREALRGAGFDVISRANVTQKQMQQALREFGGRLTAGGVGLFYFAGHGVQVKGKNFLIPIGAAIKSEAEAEDEAVDVNGVLAKMSEAGSRVNIVVLDAWELNLFNQRAAQRRVIPAGVSSDDTWFRCARGSC